MKRMIILLACFAGGCSRFTQAQMDLVTQASKGIELISKDDQSRLTTELAKLRREKLDAAFDEDVRTHAAELSPEWVIEARKAYAAGIDAFAKGQAADERAAVARERNLAAVETALERLRYLQSIQMRFSKLTEVGGEQ